VLVSHEETNWKERDLDGVDGWESRKEGSIEFIIHHLVSGDKNLAEVESVTSAVEDVVRVCQDGNDQVHDDDVEAKNDGDCVKYADNAQVIFFNFQVYIKGVVSEGGVEDLHDRVKEVLKVSQIVKEVDVAHDGEHNRQKQVQQEEVLEVLCHFSDDLNQRTNLFIVLQKRSISKDEAGNLG
jgi:hypothetical protein